MNKLSASQTRLEATKAILESEDDTQIDTLTREDLLGDMFHAGTLGYFAQLISLSHIAGLQSNSHFNLLSGHGTLGYEPDVHYFFGFPRAINSGGVAVDIPFVVNTQSNSGSQEDRKPYNLQIGTLSSALEHAVPEQMFAPTESTDPVPDGISTVKALQKAAAEGQRIYQITQANLDQVMPNLNLDSQTEDEIEDAVRVGNEVTVHTDNVSVPGWSGAGYIILDPNTGLGAYKISGGSNGGWYTLLAAASAALLVVAVGTFSLYASPLVILLTSIAFTVTTILALINGVNFTEFGDEIAYIGLLTSLMLLIPLISISVALGATVMANLIVVVGLTFAIGFGIYYLGEFN